MISTGSVASVTLDTREHQEYIWRKYKNAFEIPQSVFLQYSIDVMRFVDQSSSLNAFFADPQFSKVYSWDMMGWKNGLKTGMYYLRRLPREYAINFALKDKNQSGSETDVLEPVVCNMDPGCESCSG